MSKTLKIIAVAAVFALATAAVSFSAEDTPVERGKALFNNPNFAGGIRPCSACHPDGRGLSKAGEKKEFTIFGKKQATLEEAVNFCIVNGNKGKTIGLNTQEMKDIVVYIRSLKAPVPGYGMPGAPGY